MIARRPAMGGFSDRWPCRVRRRTRRGVVMRGWIVALVGSEPGYSRPHDSPSGACMTDVVGGGFRVVHTLSERSQTLAVRTPDNRRGGVRDAVAVPRRDEHRRWRPGSSRRSAGSASLCLGSRGRRGINRRRAAVASAGRRLAVDENIRRERRLLDARAGVDPMQRDLRRGPDGSGSVSILTQRCEGASAVKHAAAAATQ